MDLYNHETTLSQSHYESNVLMNNEHAFTQKAKLKAFDYMDQLEGWCTKNKASIIMDLIFMLKPKTIVEIGVWGGKSLVPMAHALRINHKGTIYGIDPWDSAASAEGMEGVNYDWWSSVNHEKILYDLQIKIMEFDLQSYIELIKMTSESAPAIQNIDILHIDGNHSEKTSNLDVKKWVPLVKKGGFIIFDDMTWGSNYEAVKWLDKNCIKLAEYHESNVWGIWVKP